MSQIFHRHTNVYSRLSILALVVVLGALGAAVGALNWSGYNTNQSAFVEQPIQFSHAHHVGGMGIDCRYCHTTVEESAFANIPPKSNRRSKPYFSTWLYRERNLIERFFSKLKHFRRVATRYDKLAENFLAMAQLASMRLWLRVYESTA